VAAQASIEKRQPTEVLPAGGSSKTGLIAVVVLAAAAIIGALAWFMSHH
jgi:hypothetical protein